MVDNEMRGKRFPDGMKENDIFERAFDGDILRFQLTGLYPRDAAIRLLDDSLKIDKDITYHLGRQCSFRLATLQDGTYVTTKEGNGCINALTVEIRKRIEGWRNSLFWIGSNTSLNEDEAEALVDKLHKALRPDYHPRYLPAVVRWACYGEIAPDDETDMERMRKLITAYQEHIGIRTKDSMARLGYKVEFKKGDFKRFDKDGTVAILAEMKALEEAIRPWVTF